MPLPRLEGKTGHGGSSRQAGGLQGTFQPGCVLLLAEREHRSPAIGGTGCKSTLPGTSSSVTHARIPAPALAEETTPVNHLHGEEVVAVGGNIKARSKRRRAKRSSPPPFTSLASFSSRGFPGLWAQSCSTAGAGELRGQLMAEGGGGGAGQGKRGGGARKSEATLTDAKTCLRKSRKSQKSRRLESQSQS